MSPPSPAIALAILVALGCMLPGTPILPPAEAAPSLTVPTVPEAIVTPDGRPVPLLPPPTAPFTPGAIDHEALYAAGLRRDLLGANQVAILRRYVPTLVASRREALDSLLGAAANETERIFIIKALAAGEPDDRVASYAASIRGKGEDAVISGSTMRDDSDLIQQWEDACGPSLLMVAAGEVDPRYAWELNQNFNLAQVSPHGANAGLANQQKVWLEEYGGVAVPRGQAGGKGIGILHLLNDKLAPITQATYRVVPVTDKHVALTAIADSLMTGYDVPFRVSWKGLEKDDGSAAHFMLAIAADGSAGNRRIQVHDSYTGRTAWITEASFANDSLSPIFARYGRLTHYYAPNPMAR